MADTEHTFAATRARLEDIVGQVRKKDVSLETSLDLLEEGVRLANACTEHIDHTEWRTVAGEQPSDETGEGVSDDEARAVDPGSVEESEGSPPDGAPSEA